MLRNQHGWYKLSYKLRLGLKYCTELCHALLSKRGDRGGTVVKVLRYKSDGRWFDISQPRRYAKDAIRRTSHTD
jgi:hypothetical protein